MFQWVYEMSIETGYEKYEKDMEALDEWYAGCQMRKYALELEL